MRPIHGFSPTVTVTNLLKNQEIPVISAVDWGTRGNNSGLGRFAIPVPRYFFVESRPRRWPNESGRPYGPPAGIKPSIADGQLA
jgi:hypothetical protein